MSVQMRPSYLLHMDVLCDHSFVHQPVLLQLALQPQDTKLSMLLGATSLSLSMRDQNVVLKTPSNFVGFSWFSPLLHSNRSSERVLCCRCAGWWQWLQLQWRWKRPSTDWMVVACECLTVGYLSSVLTVWAPYSFGRKCSISSTTNNILRTSRILINMKHVKVILLDRENCLAFLLNSCFHIHQVYNNSIPNRNYFEHYVT